MPVSKWFTYILLRPWLLAVQVMVLSSAGVTAQTGTDPLFVDAVTLAGDREGLCRLDLLVAVPYALVSFERVGQVYVGRYACRMRVSRDDTLVFDTTYHRDVTTSSYDVTVGRTSAWEFYQRSFALPSGRVIVEVVFTDGRINGATSILCDVDLPDYLSAPFAISQAILVSRIAEERSGHTITPILSSSVPHDDPFFLFYETYNSSTEQRVETVVEIRDIRDRVVSIQPTGTRMLSPGTTRSWSRVLTSQLPAGEFKARLVVRSASDTTLILGTSTKHFTIQGTSGSVAYGDEELAEKTRQLRYVATQNEIDDINGGSTLAERQRRYAAFWSRLDTSPETVDNECMIEYLARVEYVSTNFRSYAAGWLTDKGRIYVVLGPPDNVTTDPYLIDGRVTETWYYGSRNLHITFVDQTGFGDFRLSSPIGFYEKYTCR